MKRVTLTDAVVLSLSKNPAACSAFPVLNNIKKASAAKSKRGCSRCGQRRKLSSTVMSVRTALGANPAAIKKIKRLLKADKLVMYVRNSRGLTQRREL